MTAKTKFKSDAFEAIHSAAAGMHSDGIIGKKTMREYDALSIAKTPSFSPVAIREIRESNNLSQPIFAVYLNVSKSTVEKWESGEKHPTGAALRLLSVVKRHGLKVLG
jgi:putative transcriptional regulator